MIESEENADQMVAHHVYVIMKRNVSLSRSCRVQWYFKNLNTLMQARGNDYRDNEDADDFEVISFVPRSFPRRDVNSDDSCGHFRLVSTSLISILAHKYSFVFCLDLSPSMAVVDFHHCTVVIDEVAQSMEKCLAGLLQPFYVPGSEVLMQPQLFVTVIAQIPYRTSKVHQVIVQGCCITQENLTQFVLNINSELNTAVNQLAEEVQSVSHVQTTRSNGSVRESTSSLLCSETDFVSLVRQGILATSLLPESALTGIIVVTDGVVNVSDVNSLQGLLMQLRASDISCSFLQLGTQYRPQSCFGYVPYTDLTSFISLATGGACFDTLPTVQQNFAMNCYHRLLLTWGFQYDLIKTKVEPSYLKENLLNSWNIRNPYFYSNEKPNLLKKKHQCSNIHTTLFNVLSCRLQEGYFLQSLCVKDNNHIEVTMILPWKNNVNLLYVISTVWRSSQPNQSCHYEVISESPYEFLRDFTCVSKDIAKSVPRMAVIEQFCFLLHRLRQIDHLLYHMQSFSFNPVHYTIPETMKNRVPLFSCSSNSTSLSLYSSDFSHPAFEAYWKPICMLDVNIWQKWFHVHRLVVLLEPDHPLPKHLHLPNTNGRYQVVQCRQALAVLQALFTDWSSFILVDNHSFIKFLQAEGDKPPTSFCLARILSKAPCIVVHLAFLGGTSEEVRYELVDELKTKILSLTIPHRPKVKDALVRKGIVSSTVDRTEDAPGMERFRRGSSQVSCCILLDKSLDRVLVKYEKVPEEFWNSMPYFNNGPGNQFVYQKTLSTPLSSVSCYLFHRRWIWAIKRNSCKTDGLVSVGRILSTLVKMRLQESFRFAYSHSGIINLVLEVEMKQYDGTESEHAASRDKDEACHCIIQYILFPPHTMTANMRESISEEDMEGEANEGDSELQLVCECWIEPQSGVVINTTSEYEYLAGLDYKRIGGKIHEHDYECISAMVTFEHVSTLCQANAVSNVDNGVDPPSGCVASVQYIPFSFQPIKLLSKFQQLELLFSTYIQAATTLQIGDNDEADGVNELLFDLLHGYLRKLHDSELPLTDNDQAEFMKQVVQREQDYHDITHLASFSNDPGANRLSRKMVKQAAFDVYTDIVNADRFGTIRWKCYAKGATASHITLTFLPENFKELKKFVAERSSIGTDNRNACYFETTVAGGDHPTDDDFSETTANNLFTLESVDVRSTFDAVTANALNEPIFGSLFLPVYVYSCSLLNLVGQLTCKEKMRGCDNFFDFTFKHRHEMLGEDTITLRSETQSSENSKLASPEPHCEETTVAAGGHVEGHLQTFRKSLELIFLKTFVVGVFKNLHLQRRVHPFDVLTATDHICSESLLEIDISSFLQIVCKHVRDYKTKTALETLHSDSTHPFLGGNVQKKVASQDSGSADLESESDCLQRAKQKFPLSLLKNESCCVDEWHLLLKKKFNNILCKSFLQVPTCEDFFFYCPPNYQQACNESGSNSGNELNVPTYSSDGQESETFHSETVEFRSELESTSLFSNKPVKSTYDTNPVEVPASGSLVDSYSINSSINDMTGESSIECEDHIPPLFLHLMCTVRADNNLKSCSVRNVPSCIGHIIKCMESSVQEIDLNDFQVTLDINCLTLPPDLEVHINGKITDLRTSSFSSISPVSSESQYPFEQDPISEDEYQTESQSDQLNHLPEFQHRAVTNSVEEIKWLLRDEIAAAMLESFPLTEATLDMVAFHVQSSSGCPGCLLEEVPLQFVFGPDQSLDKFTQEFRQMSLNQYQLKNEGKYYYLVMKASDMKRTSYGQVHFGFASKCLFIQTNPHSNDTTALRQIGIGGDQEATSDEGLQLCSSTLLKNSTKLKSVRRFPVSQAIAEYDTESEDCKESVRSGSRSRKSSHGQRSVTQNAHLEAVSSADVKLASETTAVQELADLDAPEASDLKEVVDSIASDLNKSSSATNLVTSLKEVQDVVAEELCWKMANVAQKHQAMNPMAGLGSDVSSLLGSGQCSNEDGYDGDSSDIENESDWVNDLEIQRPVLPGFWLILQVFGHCAKVYFHTRDLDDHNDHHQGMDVVKKVIKNVKSICKIVNQSLLLQDLHDTRMCNQLLEPEGTEDIWKANDPVVTRRKSISSHAFQDDENENYDYHHSFLKANLDFKPGTFACDVIWHTNFLLHPRLKTGPGRSGVSRGIQALRTVLNSFSVNNRENMFVYAGTEGSVFYLRLRENQCSISQTFGDLTPGSRSSSMIVLNAKKTSENEEDCLQDQRPRVNSASEHEAAGDNASVASRSSLCKFRMEDTIQLLVHGIADVGLEITEELVKVLQNRLDEAVLDVISIMLIRNPMCKLTKEDVQFLQRPNESPTRILHFTIHAHALAYLQAMRVYLYQNLQQFLNLPKYIDNKVEFHFQDFSFDSDSPQKDADIFLYNRPQGSGNKGIAVIALSFVNGLGDRVQCLTAPKIPSNGERIVISPFEFETLTSTNLYEIENAASAKHPGPMALIRFSIWERGKLDAEQLTEKLQKSVRHALWDFITEYMVLVAPLVEDLPLDSSAICSEPVTPIKGKRAAKLQEPLFTKFVSSSLLTQMRLREHSASVPDLVVKSRSPVTSPKDPLMTFKFMGSPSVPCTPHPSSMYRHDVEGSDVDIESHKLEDGLDSGGISQLVNVYSSTAREWLEFAINLGVPSVTKHNFALNNRHLLPNIMKEMFSLVKAQGLEINLKMFSQAASEDDLHFTSCGVPTYSTKNTDGKSTADVHGGAKTFPGYENNFIIVGRNFKHWRACQLEAEFCSLFGSNIFGRLNLKFPSVYQPSVQEREESVFPANGTHLSICVSADNECAMFVPRQILLFLTMCDKNITIYTYNWAQETLSSFVQKMKQLVVWNNNRAYLLKELFLQKMGLFYNSSGSQKTSREFLAKETTSGTLGSSSVSSEMELMKSSSPIVRETPPTGPTQSQQTPSGNAGTFRQTYRDVVAKQPFHKGEYQLTGDPILDHCIYLQELRQTINKEMKMKSVNIPHSSGSLSSCILMEENILAIRHLSRLEHYCFTPLLFLPQWRWQVAAARDHTVHSMSLLQMAESTPKSSETQSRHSSGGSSKSLDLKNRRQSINLPILQSAHNSPKILPQRICNEDIWHTPLCVAYIQEFIQYLQNLGFVSLQIKSASAKKSSQKEEGAEFLPGHKRSPSSTSLLRHQVHYVQKMLLGGSVIILELCVNEPYFCVRIFALEGLRTFITSSRLPPNSQFTTAFIDECDKLKNLLHMHSFTYDYHLRSIHSYISGRQLIFRQGYHLTSFLDDFVKYYQKSPNFSWNLIYHDVLTFEDMSIPGDQLYNHLLDHDKLYGMQAMRMTPVVQDLQKDSRIEFILVQLSSQKVSYKDSYEVEHTDDFDISLLISQESASNFYINQKSSNAFLLLYYIILTSRRELYPRIAVEKKLGKFRTVTMATPVPSRKVSLVSMDRPDPDKLEVFSQQASTCSSSRSHDGSQSDIKEAASSLEHPSSSLPSTPAIHVEVRRLSTSDSDSIATSLSVENQNRAQMGIRQESVNYLGYFSTTEELMNKIVMEQAQAAKERIHKILAKATVHWRRDTYWKRLFTASRIDSQEKGKHREDSKELAALDYEEFSDLLSLVSSQSLSSIDPRLIQFANMHITWYMGLMRVLIAKYPDSCCHFVEPDGYLQHVVVLNPSYNDHFMLLTVDGSSSRAKLCAVFRKCPTSADPCSHTEHPFHIHEQTVQAAIEEFVGTCCFHLWNCML